MRLGFTWMSCMNLRHVIFVMEYFLWRCTLTHTSNTPWPAKKTASNSRLHLHAQNYMKHPKILENQVRREITSTLCSIPFMTLLTVPVFLAEVRLPLPAEKFSTHTQGAFSHTSLHVRTHRTSIRIAVCASHDHIMNVCTIFVCVYIYIYIYIYVYICTYI